jgi:hypothetical protein
MLEEQPISPDTRNKGVNAPSTLHSFITLGAVDENARSRNQDNVSD